MKGLKLSAVLGAVFAVLLSVMFASAVQSFSVSPTSITDTVGKGTSASETFTLTNTGNESITLLLTKTDLILSSDSFSMSLNDTSVTLPVGNSSVVKVTYAPSSSKDTGVYNGNVTITNSANSSHTSKVSLAVTVQSTGASISIDDEDDNTIEISGDLDESVTKRIRIRNDGSIDFTNVEFTFYDLEGEDGGDEIEANDQDIDDDGFDLDVDDSESVEIEVDIPRNIEIDTYVGEFRITTNEGYNFDFDIEVEVEGGDIDIVFKENTLNVRNGVLEMVGEAGETLDNYEFVIDNEGDVNVNNLEFELDGDLEEEFTSATIDSSYVTFSPSSVDLDSGDDDTVEVTVAIPDDAASGTYSTKINVLSSTGKEYDDIRLEVKVVGDIYIKEITYDNEIEPGENLDVSIVVKNQGSKIYRNIKVTGTLFDVDVGNSDVIETTSTFLLNSGEEQEKLLRFKIPEEASDGSHTLELRLKYDSEELVEVEDVIVTRPVHNIIVDSFGITPSVAKCDDTIYTFMKAKNLGKYDEDVRFSAEILTTNIKKQSSTFELSVDESYQNNQVLDISALDVETYTVILKVEYNSGLLVRKESKLTVLNCTESTVGGIDIKPIEDGNQTLVNETNSKIKLFGSEVEKTTVYLGTGVGAVFILIIVSLFFL